MESKYIAHKTDEMVQTVKEHSCNTSDLCKQYSIEALKDLIAQIGLLHDIGKYQRGFQRRIAGDNIRIEHAICGAIEAQKLLKSPPSRLMCGYCIAGHHTGIPDGGNFSDSENMATLQGRLKRTTENYEEYCKELKIEDVDETKLIGLLQNGSRTKAEIIDKFAFFTRYAFSCLTDADSIDTAKFFTNDTGNGLKADYKKCLDDVNQLFSSFKPQTELQKARSRIQEQIYFNSKENADIYCINMPTGSGKTLCSIKIALEKAIDEHKKRIIYVIPYNSIIDQTAEVFENLFGKHAQILRHQSTFSYEENYSEDYAEKANKAMENWDSETIIVTTSVQFFESIYKNKRVNLRKMHNMQDSIIVFDEVHLLPVEYMQPCLQAISYITRYLRSEVIFLSGTMPEFSKMFLKYSDEATKIVLPVKDKGDFKFFDKCKYENIKDVTLENIVEKASSCPSSLIIVNSKSTARQVYSMLPGKKYHLSTYMTAYDRQKTITEIKKELQLLEIEFTTEEVPPDRRVQIVSTSLIEAGVDLDLHAVFREITGLDSILQSGGRCNREGKRQNGTVYIFSLEENKSKEKDIKTSITESMIEEYTDISAEECVVDFYNRIYEVNEDFITQNTISKLCNGFNDIPFATYAENFNIIDSDTVSIVVPQDEYSQNLIDLIEENEHVHKISSKLQLYTCSISKKEFKELESSGVIAISDCGVIYLTNNDYYNNEIGILFEEQDYFL